ncbi:hypothetical protein EMCRGX_G015424 [Ephydatia muelleri]
MMFGLRSCREGAGVQLLLAISCSVKKTFNNASASLAGLSETTSAARTFLGFPPDLYLYSYTERINLLLAGPPSTFIIVVRMWGPPRYSGLHHDNVENNAQEMVVCQQFRFQAQWDRLVWARDWTHLDEQCGMDCQPPSR